MEERLTSLEKRFEVLLGLFTKLAGNVETMRREQVKNFDTQHEDIPVITCCGEWVWKDDENTWVNRAHMDEMLWVKQCNNLEVVCKKCHRALLEGGKMTGPLVDVSAEVIRRIKAASSFPLFLTDDSIMKTLLNDTWGTDS